MSKTLHFKYVNSTRYTCMHSHSQHWVIFPSWSLSDQPSCVQVNDDYFQLSFSAFLSSFACNISSEISSEKAGWKVPPVFKATQLPRKADLLWMEQGNSFVGCCELALGIGHAGSRRWGDVLRREILLAKVLEASDSASSEKPSILLP